MKSQKHGIFSVFDLETNIKKKDTVQYTDGQLFDVNEHMKKVMRLNSDRLWVDLDEVRGKAL